MEIQWKNLIERARNNDQAAFSELYEHSYDAVYRTVKSMVKDEDTAMDLVQDAFISGFANPEGFQPPENFIPWMRRIATNKARDWFRKKHDVAFSQLGDEEDVPPEFKDESPESSPEEVLDQQETSRLIEEILGTLSDEQRMAVGMYYYEEMPVAEIAAELGVSENTVKSRLNYGRKKIKAGVEELERKGTKLYSLAPVPFFLWLLHCQKAQAAIGALPVGGAPAGLLHNILEQVSALGAGAGTAAAAASTAATSTTAASTAAASTAAASTTAASATAVSTAAAAAVKGGIFASLGAKIAAGVAAAVLVGGVSVGVVSLTRGGLTKPEETLPGITSSESAQAPETNAPTETGSPTETTGSANPTEPEEITDSKGLKYELADGENGYIVVGIGECTDTNIKIPATHEDLPVIGIGYAAFEGCTGLTSVTIPASVTEIGEAAFSRCTGLTSITIPDSVTTIARYVFNGCSGLTSITFPDGVKEIGDYAFRGCTGLTSITIPDGVTWIGDNAFEGCTGLTTITIPDSVTVIGISAFSDCTSLTSITIPDGVTSIGSGVFAGCTGLTSITVAAGNPVYHSAGNCLIETEREILIAGCKTSVIPNDGSVVAIGDEAFRGCTGLTSITFPDSMKGIGVYAFEGCTGLTSIEIPNGVAYFDTWAFAGCTGLTSITIPDSVEEIGLDAFSGCSSLTDISYGGSETQWAELTKEADVPETATVHYSSKG